LAESGNYLELAQEAFHCGEKITAFWTYPVQTSAAEKAATLHGILHIN
jgi:hypothetical protein